MVFTKEGCAEIILKSGEIGFIAITSPKGNNSVLNAIGWS